MKRFLTVLLLSLAVLPGYGQAFTFVSSTTFSPALSGGAFRGLSGIDYVPGNGWYIVSDRGGSKDRINEGNLFLTTTMPPTDDVQRLTTLPSSLEGIRYDAARDRFFLSGERDSVATGEQDSTAILMISGNQLRSGAPPSRLLSRVSGSPNKGIEGMAIMPSGQLWVAPEAGWPNETALNVPNVHFLRYKDPLSSQAPDSLSYPIDRFPNAYFNDDKPGGIAEILALDDSTLLVLERAYHIFLSADQTRREVVLARLYWAHIHEVSQTITKEVAFDFNDLSQFPDVVRNLEGMSWGPAAPNGKRRLYLVTDDNFEDRPARMATQRNQWIVLELR